MLNDIIIVVPSVDDSVVMSRVDCARLNLDWLVQLGLIRLLPTM
jgi:hypothetical protein